jgi:hypothetical protein
MRKRKQVKLTRDGPVINFDPLKNQGTGQAPLKGGDPAPGSPRATLLRLHPSHRFDRGRSLPKLGSRLKVKPTPMV